MLTAMCIEAANYIIKRTNDYNEDNPTTVIFMTCKRLQKLLYFSEVEFMKRNDGKSMFSDEFHAWPSGPVIPFVYHKFMKYQYGKMETIDEPGHSILTQAMKDALEFVLRKTWDLDVLDLIEISHIPDGPWRRFYNDADPKHEQIIPKREIFAFYKTREIFA